MTRHSGLIAAGGALSIGAVALLSGTTAPSVGAVGASSPGAVRWQPCPQYSDGAIESLRVQPEQIPRFRALLARLECGTVSVPLDYARPTGRHITVAITRLKATDQAHRLGSLAINPGGPGGSGYLVPETLLLTGSTIASLNDRYDLIGFDPRGVGYSTKANCQSQGGPPPTPGDPPPSPSDPPPDQDGPPPGPLTEELARQFYADQVRISQACLRTDPDLLLQLTTANVARDLNQVRRALHEPTISYFGVSWGTLLGAVYRSMFPATVSRMWLDSVVGPTANRLDVRAADTAKATEQAAARLAKWIADRNATYRLGNTPAQVRATMLAIKRNLDANPVKFSDVPAAADGNLVAFLAMSISPLWTEASQALTELVGATSGTPAPPALKSILSPLPPQPIPPADAPEQINPTAGQAMLCNDDTSPHDFASFWRSYQRIVARNPVTGSLTLPTQPCAGWPTPAQPFQLRRTSGSLELSGHRYETLTPYPWTAQLQATIGGHVLTVNDDAHGSVPFTADCAEHLAAYFGTGRPDNGQCQGVTGTTPPPGQAAASAAASQASVGLAGRGRRSWSTRFGWR